MTSDLKNRIESGDLHFLDGLVLLGTIASQRWFGGKSKDVLDARVLDAGVTPGDPPILAIAIVEVFLVQLGATPKQGHPDRWIGRPPRLLVDELAQFLARRRAGARRGRRRAAG